MGKRKNKKKDLSFRSFLKKCDLKDSKFKKKKDPFKHIMENNLDNVSEAMIDNRFQINFAELSRKSYENALLPKSKRGHLEINVYPIIQGTLKLQTYPIRYDDIAYFILEVYKDLEFPRIESITGPGRDKKRETAICLIGGDSDKRKEIHIERDMKLIHEDEDLYMKPLNGFKIKRIHFERLIHYVIDSSIPKIGNDGLPHVIPVIDSLQPVTRQGIFFDYVITGYVIMKNGVGYKLGDTLILH